MKRKKSRYLKRSSARIRICNRKLISILNKLHISLLYLFSFIFMIIFGFFTFNSVLDLKIFNFARIISALIAVLAIYVALLLRKAPKINRHIKENKAFFDKVVVVGEIIFLILFIFLLGLLIYIVSFMLKSNFISKEIIIDSIIGIIFVLIALISHISKKHFIEAMKRLQNYSAAITLAVGILIPTVIFFANKIENFNRYNLNLFQELLLDTVKIEVYEYNKSKDNLALFSNIEKLNKMTNANIVEINYLIYKATITLDLDLIYPVKKFYDFTMSIQEIFNNYKAFIESDICTKGNITSKESINKMYILVALCSYNQKDLKVEKDIFYIIWLSHNNYVKDYFEDIKQDLHSNIISLRVPFGKRKTKYQKEKIPLYIEEAEEEFEKYLIEKEATIEYIESNKLYHIPEITW